MRRSILLLALCISCGDDSGQIAEVPDPETFYQISGVVRDSVLYRAIPGIRIRIGDSLAVSDSMGRFSVVHRAGSFALTVDDYEYERHSIPLVLFQDQPDFIVRLRGHAPYLLSCTFQSDLLTGRIMDLQGRKTINRRSQSTITLVTTDTLVTKDAYSWYFTPVDNLTWLAHVPLAGVAADTAVWRLEDADGYVRGDRCVNQPAPCTVC